MAPRLIAEDFGDANLEAGQQQCREDAISLRRQLLGAREALAGPAIDPNDLDVGIDDPVFDDPGSFVEPALDRFVVLGVGVALLLLDRGWVLETGVGRPAVMRKASQAIDPFESVHRLATGQLKVEEWKAQCSAAGIAGCVLGGDVAVKV